MKKIKRGNPYPMGAFLQEKGKIQFVIRGFEGKEYSLIIYDKKTGKRDEIPLGEEYRIGNLYSVLVEGLNEDRICYTILEDGCEKTDPYAKVIYGNEVWGNVKKEVLKAGACLKPYPWEDDKMPGIPLENSVFYQLHVRGFTRHASSKVKKKGTFEGIIEKIPYLKELGITALELLPSYEFNEVEADVRTHYSMEEMKEQAAYTKKENSLRLNYWGFKEAFYFVPKASYSGSGNPSFSFKDMVKNLHRQGIEVVMQFYFPLNIPRAMIIEVLQFWVEEYHVDGFRLLGVHIPVELLAGIPKLANIKILYECFNENDIYSYQQIPLCPNLASYNDSYMYSQRKFLKSDVGSLQQAFQEFLNAGTRIKRMIYITNYNSFTLQDLVSYDRKHNEDNGENGTDGNNCNLSWNCGIEGNTRKKSILDLRKQQMRNAMSLLLMSRGIPVILSGDEFCNSQKGNNNPYCQDNLISWINWKDLDKNKEFFNFTCKLISLRKEEILKKEKSLKALEGEKLPEVSFHGKDAWKLDWSAANEEAGGILFVSESSFLYMGINMHWKEALLALPALAIKEAWSVIVDTAGKAGQMIGRKEKQLRIPSRSIIILRAERKEKDVKGITAF